VKIVTHCEVTRSSFPSPNLWSDEGGRLARNPTVEKIASSDRRLLVPVHAVKKRRATTATLALRQDGYR
jgi:hypothetical protein